MKKSILLIIMFLTIFVSNGTKVSATASCSDKKGYDNVCTYMNENGEVIKLYYNSKDTYLISNLLENNSHYKLYNYNGVPEKKFMEKSNCESKLPNGCLVQNYTYYNNISAADIGGGCPAKIYNYIFYDKNWNGDPDFTKTYTYWLLELGDVEDPDDSFFDESSHTVYDFKSDCKGETVAPEGCKDLIDEDVRKYINDIMTYIKIGIPILLIGLIVYDLATAIFAGSDDKINKAKGRAVKRIIIAVIIFFIPTLINFVFDLVNNVWSTKFEICGLETNQEE